MGKIRIMNLVLRDEEGVEWNRISNLPGLLEVTTAIERADRVVIHVESERLAREPAGEEVAVLALRVSRDGQPGEVLASAYRVGAKELVLLTVTDRS